MSFKKNYKAQLLSELQIAFPKIEKYKLQKIIDENYDKFIKNPEASLVNKDEEIQTTLIDLIDWIEKNNPIISGYAAFYYKHGYGHVNLLLDMFDFLLKTRKKVKKEMLQHVNDKDQEYHDYLDLIQGTYKLLANSGYGATIEKNSIFYDENFGASVTYTGFVIITTAVNAFENFMSNNFHFEKINDVLWYIRRIIDENYEFKDIIDDDKHISKLKLSKYLFNKMDNKKEEYFDFIKNNIVKNLSQYDIDRIYYKNNLYKFLNNSIINNKISKIIGDTTFLNPNEPSKEIKEVLDYCWKYIKEWCLFDHLHWNRLKNAEFGVRKTVLTINKSVA